MIYIKDKEIAEFERGVDIGFMGLVLKYFILSGKSFTHFMQLFDDDFHFSDEEIHRMKTKAFIAEK